MSDAKSYQSLLPLHRLFKEYVSTMPQLSFGLHIGRARAEFATMDRFFAFATKMKVSLVNDRADWQQRHGLLSKVEKLSTTSQVPTMITIFCLNGRERRQVVSVITSRCQQRADISLFSTTALFFASNAGFQAKLQACSLSTERQFSSTLKNLPE